MSMVSAKREIYYIELQYNCVYMKHRYVTMKDYVLIRPISTEHKLFISSFRN